MRNILKALGIMAIVLLGFTPAHAGFSLTVGTSNSYLSVGDYDYLPYTAGYGTPRVDFYDVMGQYGGWVYAPQFGRVWRPYVSYGWRPYTQGHWIYTQYGPTWVGYEPWAWAAYHYGNWIFTPSYGWVWIPGYDWHPGRVMWSHSYGSIGWSPAPPYGYDYSRGYLSYRGSYNQYTYDDNDFDRDDYYGGGYYNRGYNDLYYNSGYQQIAPQIWVFIQINNFNSDNYSNCYFGGSYARQVFENRMVRLTPRPLPRVYVEKNTHQQIREIGVHVKEMQANDHRIKMVIPDGEEDVVRKHANETVKQFIAPGFAEKQKQFKGTASKNQPELARVFKQDNSKPQVEKLSTDQLLNQVKLQTQEGDRRREENEKKQVETIVRMKKQTDVQPADRMKIENEKRNQGFNSGNGTLEPPVKNGNRDSQFDRRNENSDNNSQVERNNDSIRNRNQYQEPPQDKTNHDRQFEQQWTPKTEDRSKSNDLKNQQDQFDRQRNDQKRIDQQKQFEQQQQDRVRQDQLDQERTNQSQRRYLDQMPQDDKNNSRDDQFRKNRNDQSADNPDLQDSSPEPEPTVDQTQDGNRDQSSNQEDKQKSSSHDKHQKDKSRKHQDNPKPPNR